jgi:VCBS repeat-containing protein
MKKKGYLFVVSLVFIVTLLNVAPRIIHNSTDSDSLTSGNVLSSPYNEFHPQTTPVLTGAPPEADDDSYTADEDSLLIVTAPGVLGNDHDVDGDTLIAMVDNMPSHGSLSLSQNGSFTYISDANFFGADTFTYHANDGGFDSNPATVIITVNPVNDPPVAVDDSYQTDEDVPLIVAAPGVLVNDYDVDLYDYLTAELVTKPEHGSIVLFFEGDIHYTPAPDWNGVDHFEYRVFDSFVYGNNATVTIVVNPVNDAPIAADDAFTINEDTVLHIFTSNLTSNDYDADGDSLHIFIESYPTSGTLSILSAQEFLYTPNPDWYGTDSFTYRAFDGIVNSSIVQVVITVIDVIDDITPPSTTVLLAGSLGDNGWYITDVTVTLFATDDTSKMITTSYSFDGSNWIEYTGPFVYSLEGITTIYFNSTDEYGNVEATNTQAFKIDSTFPQTQLTTERIYGGVIVTLSAEDAVSGVREILYSFDQLTWIMYIGPFILTSGNVVPISHYAIDMAGLAEESQTTEVVVDNIPPETSISLVGTLGDNGWFISDVIVTLTATDEFSVASTMYSLDGINWFVYAKPFTIAADGITTVYYFSTDDASNAELTKSDMIIIDTDITAPIITITYSGDATDGNPGYWTVSVADPESGIATITVEIDGIPMGNLPGDYAVPNLLGFHTIRVNATNADLVLGIEDQEFSTLSETVTIVDDDQTAPQLVITHSGGTTVSDPGVWTITASDLESGIASLIVEIDGELAGTTPGEYAVPASEGTHTISVTAYNGDLDRGATDQEMSIASASVTISSELTPGWVTGAGWIVDGNGNKGHFAFVVKLKSNGDISGVFLYSIKVGKLVYLITSTEIFEMAIDGNHAYFEAKCNFMILNLHNCRMQHSGNYVVRVDVWDNQGRCMKDIFQIRIYDASGQVWYEAGYDSIGSVHGAIVIHLDKHLKWSHCHCGRW